MGTRNAADDTPAPTGGSPPGETTAWEGGRYLNRELSWLSFNERVLARAGDPDAPLLDRVRFLAIHTRNLDEFVMTRVAGLQRRHETGIGGRDASGMSTREQLRAINTEMARQVGRVHTLWAGCEEELRSEGVELLTWEDTTPAERERARTYYHELVHPILTPLAIDAAHPFPYITGLALNLGVVSEGPGGERRYARVKVPDNLPRLIALEGSEPVEKQVEVRGKRGRKRKRAEAVNVIRSAPRLGVDRLTLGVGGLRLLPLEELIRAQMDELLPGSRILGAHLFRVTRTAEIEVEEDRDEDLLQALERELAARRRGACVRVEVEAGVDEGLRHLLERELEVEEVQAHPAGIVMGDALDALASIDAPELHGEVHVGRVSALGADVFATLRAGDVLVHHPYESFATSVQRFVETAASDPHVLAIKQTLYRAGTQSPIVEALINAAESGKQVVAVVELTARFDEHANIQWARTLERAGVHVVYGTPGLKTHAKVTLVSREENGTIRQYAHVGTGNYHPRTARGYEDVGLLSADPGLTRDLTTLFNELTGYSATRHYERALIAPEHLREGLLEQIANTVARHERGETAGITWKVNHLVDETIIDALYAASSAGVRIEVIARTTCALRPGVRGLSENIRVRSVLGRFLEHSRIFRFHGAGEAEWWIGSADMMHRNLDRRVEAVIPVRDPACGERLAGILTLLTSGNVERWELDGEGAWHHHSGDDAQAELIAQAR